MPRDDSVGQMFKKDCGQRSTLVFILKDDNVGTIKMCGYTSDTRDWGTIHNAKKLFQIMYINIFNNVVNPSRYLFY